MAPAIITRTDARAQGLKRYYTGKLCKRGHTAERYVCNLDCVLCVFEKTKKRQWHKANPERHREHNRKWNKENKAYRIKYALENREKLLAYFKKRWHAKPSEERRAKKKAWYEANRAHAVEYTAKWAAENPEKSRALAAAYQRRRCARTISVGGTHTADDLTEILKSQAYRCAYCRADLRKVKKHLDHIMPLSRGGSNDKTNLQWLCLPCNLSKGSRDPLQFAQERGLLL